MKKAALLLTAFPAFAAAQDAELDALTKPQSELSVGLGYWSKDRPRLGTYDAMNREGLYGLFDAFINSRDERTGTWFQLEGRNLGLDNRALRAEWQRQGNFGVFAEYNRTTRDEPYTVLTAVQGIGTSTQRVPSPSATELGGIHLGTVRESLGAGFNKWVAGGYDFRVNVKSEDKRGDRLWGRGGAAEFAAEPIDSNTRQMDAVLAYTGKTFQVQGGYYGSWYTNNNSMVDTNLTTGAAPYFLSLPLDNQAHQAYVNGGYNFTDATRGTFKVAYTRATQNEPIPVGTGVLVSPTAPSNLDGRLDTTLLQAGVTSRASSQFSWLASLRSYESDEKTPQYLVVGPACPGCVHTTPLTLKTVTGKLEGTYRLQQGVSLTGGLDHAKQDRNVPVGDPNPAGFDNQRYVPFRSKLDETTLRLEARRSLSETLNGRVSVAHSKRDGNEFTPGNEPQVDQINPIHLADRDRNKLRAMVDWAPSQPLTLTFSFDYARDEYGHSDARPYGLIDGSAMLFSVDASYVISERWSINAWYTRDRTEATQRGQRDGTGDPALATKEAQLEDLGDTVGVGLRGTLRPKL